MKERSEGLAHLQLHQSRVVHQLKEVVEDPGTRSGSSRMAVQHSIAAVREYLINTFQDVDINNSKEKNVY